MADLNVALRISETGAAAAASAMGGLGKALGGVASIASGFILGQGILALPDLLKDAAGRAREDEAATIRLNQSLRNLGGSFEAHTKQVNDAIAAGAKLGFTDDDIRDSFQFLAAATGSAEEALKRQKVALDFARGANIPLAQATKLLGKVTDESASAFARMGIHIEKGTSAAQTLAIIQGKFAGQADAYANSSAGQMEVVQVAFDELKESLGYAVLPLFAKLGQLVVDNLPAIQSFVELIGHGLSGAVDVALGAFDTARQALQPLIDTIGTALPKAWEAAQAVVAAFNVDAGALGIVLKDIRDVFGDTVANAIQPFVDLMIDVIPRVQDFVAALADAVLNGGTFQDAFGPIGVLLDEISIAIQGLSPVLDKVLGGDFAGAFEDAKTVLGTFVSDFSADLMFFGGQLLDWVVQQVPTITGALLSWGQAFLDWVTPLLTSLPAKLAELAPVVWQWVTDAAGQADEMLGGLAQAVLAWATGDGPPAIAKALLGLAASAWSWVTEAAGKAGDFLGGIVAAIGAWNSGTGQTPFANAFIGFVNHAWDWVETAAANATEFLGHLVDAASGWVTGGGLANMVVALQRLAEGAWDWVQEAVKTAAIKLGPILGGIADWVSNTGYPETVKIGGQLGTALLEGINAGIKALIDTAGLQPTLDALAAGLNKVEVPKNLNQSWVAWGDTLRVVSGWIDAVNKGMGGDSGTNALMKAASAIASIWVYEFGIAAKVLADVSLRIDDIVHALDRLVRGKDDIRQAMQDIGDLLGMKNIDFQIHSFDIGVQIVQGLISGIGSMVETLRTTVTNLGQALPQWLKDVLHISSPSQVMVEIGIEIGQGLVGGINAEVKPVFDAAGKLMNAVLGQVDAYGNKISNEVGSILADLAQVGGAGAVGIKPPPPGGASGTPHPGGGPIVPGGLNFQGGPNTVNNPWTGQAGPARPGFTGGPTVMGPYGPYIPSFDLGGVVRGPLGSPTLALVHGGERVLTPQQGAGQVNHFYGDNYFTGPSMLDALSTLSEMTR